MKIVRNDTPMFVYVSSVPAGGTFKRDGNFYIRPTAYGCVYTQGINLETGECLNVAKTACVEPVDLEVHEL